MIIFINLPGGRNSFWLMLLTIAGSLYLEYGVQAVLPTLSPELVMASLVLGGFLLQAFWPMISAQMQRLGVWQYLGLNGVAARQQARNPGRAHPRQQQQQPRQQRHTFDEVVHVLQALPTEVVEDQQNLSELPSHELKHRLRQQGVDPSSCLEKRDLLNKLLQLGGSSGTTCSICCEDYAARDVLRVLPCKHRYHLECVDKWFLSSTDYSRAPACPICNHKLIS